MRTGALDIAEDAMSLASGASGEVEVFAESARTTAMKISLALETERAALIVDEIETVEEAAYQDGEWRTALVSSTGISAFSESSFCYVYASAHASRAGSAQTGLGFCAGREPSELE